MNKYNIRFITRAGIFDKRTIAGLCGNLMR